MRRSFRVRLATSLLCGFVALVSATGCTVAELKTLSAVLTALGIAAPAVCPFVTAADGAAVGKVCSTDAAGATALADSLSQIVASLPPTATAPRIGMAPLKPESYEVGAFHVEIRADLCEQVKAIAKTKGARP